MIATPSPKRAGALVGVYFLVGLPLALGLETYLAHDVLALWTSGLLSIFAVGVPALVATYWPKEGAPGELPYKPLSMWVGVGIVGCSLPLYTALALLQLAISKHMNLKASADAASAVAVHSLPGLLVTLLAMALLPAAAEELMFRGFIQRAAIEKLGARWGLFTAAAIFSFLHAETASFLPLLFLGLWLGYLFWRTGSLWASTAAHVLNNAWGIAFANTALGQDKNMAWVLLASAVSLGVGLLAFREAERPPTEDLTPLSAMPRVVQVPRPGPPPPKD